MKKITVVVAGLGPRGYNTYAQYGKLFPERMCVLAIADIDKEKIEIAKKDLNIKDEYCYSSAEEMFKQEKLADVAVIATQDGQHITHALMALEKGYDLLLEKPIATTLKDCLAIQKKSFEARRLIVVCHVLRYTTFYKTIKEIIVSGKIGDVATINAVENVGYWHDSHSFVRGHWRNKELSSPMILAKCCHDLDILNFLIDKKCEYISSFGSLMCFKKENQPKGASDYCLDCKFQDTCVYSAKKIYLSKNSLIDREWLCYVVATQPTEEKLKKALKNGVYGRCVYACDNDVVDHQVVNMQYNGGVTASLTMCAFSEKCYRTIRVFGTLGEIEGNQDSNIIKLTEFGKEPVYYDINNIATDLTGHGGGDNAMLTDFITKLDHGDKNIESSIINSMESHIMAFAAEDSRLNNGQNINLAEYKEKNQ